MQITTNKIVIGNNIWVLKRIYKNELQRSVSTLILGELLPKIWLSIPNIRGYRTVVNIPAMQKVSILSLDFFPKYFNMKRVERYVSVEINVTLESWIPAGW